MDPVLLPFLMLGIGITVVVMSMGKKQAKMLDGVWATAARSLGGHYAPEGGGLSGLGRRVRAEVAGRKVEVDHERLRIGDATSVCTRLRCRAEGPSELKLRVTPEGAFSGLARAVGFQDVLVGDEAFDADYVIKASDPEVAPLWLNAYVRRRIQAVPDFRFKLERGRVEALCPYLIDEPQLIVAAAEATVAFADGRQRLLRAWRKVAREHDGRVEAVAGGWARLDLEVEGVAVRVTTRDLRDRHFTEICAYAPDAAFPALVLSHERHLHEAVLPRVPDAEAPGDYALYTRDAAHFRAFFDEAIERAVLVLEPAKVRLDADRVTVLIPGIEIRKKVLLRAVALAVRLARSAERASSPRIAVGA